MRVRREKTHPADCGGSGCRSPLSFLCVCAGQPSKRNRGGEDGARQNGIRERSVRKTESWRDRERKRNRFFCAASSGFVEWIIPTST